MLGDELKKSLEPIQTSDELLAKTRAAIEKARLEQAAASLNDTSSVSRKASPRLSYFLKAAVPLACIVLVVGGLVLLIPKFSKNSDSTTKSNRSKSEIRAQATEAVAAADTVAEHNKSLDGVSDLVDSEVKEEYDSGNDNNSAAETTTAENRAPEASDTQETTSESENDKNGKGNHYLTPTLEKVISDEKTADTGDYLVCISDDGKSLYLIDKATGEKIPDSEDHHLPQAEDLDLQENETITGLSFNDEAKMLYITISENGENSGKQKVYAVTFLSGSSEGFIPILVS
ncbi:MAG: hypothetical protein J5750_00550 [Clostridiales bacterium]|nr:hypothetical protein [Clostridiales bacterium]